MTIEEAILEEYTKAGEFRGIQKGEKIGIQKGEKIGIQKGFSQAQQIGITNMLKKGFDISIIADVMEVSEEKIKAIQQEITK